MLVNYLVFTRFINFTVPVIIDSIMVSRDHYES